MPTAEEVRAEFDASRAIYELMRGREKVRWCSRAELEAEYPPAGSKAILEGNDPELPEPAP